MTVSDGALSDHQAFTIRVFGPNDAPLLRQPADMRIAAGAVETQELLATDPDGDPLEFSLVSGPPYATVETADPGNGLGYLTLAPPRETGEGQVLAAVRASDGLLGDEKSLTITISGRVNLAPTIEQIQDLTIRAGQVEVREVHASDPDGDPLTFIKALGPAYMTVTTTDPG